jgi:adenine-specific DNA methylase
MKAKKLIEVALPIKEISAESVRDNRLAGGNIRTLHIWWARRPLPTCRAIVFASLVPDPLDENCPEAFKYAVEYLLNVGLGKLHYKPYKDIPYTSIVDEMEDNHRNRLMMFVGKFSEKCQENMKAGKSTPPKEQLDDWSLIKWENKNNPKILRIARELIFVAYQSDKRPDATWEKLHAEFDNLYDAIPKAETALYELKDRHIETDKVKKLEAELQTAIDAFQNEMPSVFDPFAGGGAIPLEAARLGCRSYGNDINPVAHIIERGSADFPQKYGKPIVFTKTEFDKLYGEDGQKLAQEDERITFDGCLYHIPNRLAFDIKYYATCIIKKADDEIGKYYPKDDNGNTVTAYYWVRNAVCSNPSCKASIPMLRNFYLCNTNKNHIYLKPNISGNIVNFDLIKGKYSSSELKEWNHHGTITCPCCGSVTNVKDIKSQSREFGLKPKFYGVISESDAGRVYSVPSEKMKNIINDKNIECIGPEDYMPQNDTQNIKVPFWGFKKWKDLFSPRQLRAIQTFIKHFNDIKGVLLEDEYNKAVIAYLAIWIDRIVLFNTMFSRWNDTSEKIQHVFGRQAISMLFDYVESNPFCTSSGSASNQLDWVLKYIDSESSLPFAACFANSSSGDKLQFDSKNLTAVVTDPPYYDAIAYSDCSDFFYVWLKQTLGDVFPINFSTPLTPKIEECTAIKHRHNGDENEAKKHFENKLTDIFDAIETQTSDIVSIMYAHQSTQAWTTLCNSILGARMNITGSWSLDTEMAGGLKTDKSYLESSVTVACRPSERKGFADFDEVKHDIRQLVKAEVEKLYGLGFRGADLLTACFGQAVSVFGHYKLVETAEGDPVSVGQLLEFARESAAQALLEGVPGEPQTKFYCGWLQMNGMKECDFDDVNKYTRVGVNVEIRQLQSDKLLITEGSKQHLATAEEHVGSNENWGTQSTDYMISQVHRMMLAYRMGNQVQLLKLVRDLCPQSDAPQWRVLDFLGGHLPEESQDYKDIKGILASAEMLRQKCKDTAVPKVGTLDFED